MVSNGALHKAQCIEQQHMQEIRKHLTKRALAFEIGYSHDGICEGVHKVGISDESSNGSGVQTTFG